MNTADTRLWRLGRVLSIDPRTERIAWTFFQDSVIRDQRVQTIRKKEPADRVREHIVPYLIQLLDEFEPHAVLVPESDGIGGRRRSPHVVAAIDAIVSDAHRRGIAVHVVSNQTVKRALFQMSGTTIRNKRDIQKVVVDQFSEMTSVLPRPRTKVYQPERYFEPLFHTVAMFIAWRSQPSLNELRERRTA